METTLLILLFAFLFILAVEAFALWRLFSAQRRLHSENQMLFDALQEALDKRETAPQESPRPLPDTPQQQLFGRICALMKEEQTYTDSELRREDLAQRLGTNYNLVAEAIRTCSEGETLGEFLDGWRIRHAARLLSDTNDPIGLVAELSGFSSRSHFNTLFRDKYELTPSEYRKVIRQ